MVTVSNNDVLYIILDLGDLRPPLLIAPQHEGDKLCNSLPCRWIPSLLRWLRFSCFQYQLPHLRGAFIRVGDLDQMLETNCLDEAESKGAVAIKLSAARELRWWSE
jgi:hypothetical protein